MQKDKFNNLLHNIRPHRDTPYISYKCCKHLKTLGYVNCYNVWRTADVTEKKLMEGSSISDSLLERNKKKTFFKRIITGDANILYDKN